MDLADGLPRNGLTLRLASLVEESQAKSAEAIQPAGHQSVFPPKHQKQLLSFLKKKGVNSSGKRQAQSESTINTSAKGEASIWPWHPSPSKTSAGLLPSMRATQRLAGRKLPTIKSITLPQSGKSTEPNFQESAEQGGSQAKAAVI